MARPRNTEDVRMAEIRASVQKAELYNRSFIVFIVGLFISICFVSACWCATKILDKPAWLELALAIIGTNGAQSLVMWRLFVRLKRRVNQREQDELSSRSETP